ncbi:hypothetical protein D3C80_1325200 [compost metagenome]
MDFNFHRGWDDLPTQRCHRQHFQILVLGEAAFWHHQNVVVILGTLPLVTGERGHKLVNIFGIGI